MSSHTRGNVFLDSMLVIIVLIAFGICAIIGYKIFGELNTDIQGDSDLSNQTKQVVSTAHTVYPSVMDNGFMIIMGLLWLFVIIASVMIDSHPMFLVISILLFVFVLGIAMLLSNSFQEFAADSEFVGFDSTFPFTYWVLEHLLTVIIIMGASVMIAMFAKARMT
jgi:hypothetical protein